MAAARIKSPLSIMRNIKNPRPLRRLIQLDYPIYNLPVILKERMSEPYESLEWFITRFLHEGNVHTQEDLAVRLGLPGGSRILSETLTHLESIGHIRNAEGRYKVLKNGAESFEKREKIYEAESRRLLYFDAIALQPLPREFYEDPANVILPADNRDMLNKSFVFDLWSTLADNPVKELLRYNGNERYSFNLPQEMIEIEINRQLLNDNAPGLNGEIRFIPLFICFYGEAGGFLTDTGVNGRDGAEIEVYIGTTGKRSPYFEHLIKSNLVRVWAMIQSEEQLNKGKQLSFSVLGLKLEEYLEIGRAEIGATGNIAYPIRPEDIDKWSGSPEFQNRILRHLTYTRELPLHANEQLGPILAFRLEDKNTLNELLAILKRQNVAYYNKHEYSDAYIQKQNDHLHQTFSTTWER
ncbi:hypothetical protein DRW41_09730 [Neobacillus piezotolerans]|uniref:Uncharacterized protein n=1 Tax=Neobacillus piezotolerans TaxID=2259171 RepID=A0A3D8GRA7_9BACI|nr:hypothetical protein [Neobacillus piezotolerans]RDU36968.1 hypothetical protein DRW41_09730 [Neobacillus piezotolerans]